MTTGALRSATPEQPLSSAASKLDKVTGLAVVDESNVVVGVISIRDINSLRKQVSARPATPSKRAGFGDLRPVPILVGRRWPHALPHLWALAAGTAAAKNAQSVSVWAAPQQDLITSDAAAGQGAECGGLPTGRHSQAACWRAAQ